MIACTQKNSSMYWAFCNPNNRSLISTQDLTVLVNPYFSNNKNTEVGFSDTGVFFFISNWEILKLRIKFPRNFQDSERVKAFTGLCTCGIQGVMLEDGQQHMQASSLISQMQGRACTEFRLR